MNSPDHKPRDQQQRCHHGSRGGIFQPPIERRDARRPVLFISGEVCELQPRATSANAAKMAHAPPTKAPHDTMTKGPNAPLLDGCPKGCLRRSRESDAPSGARLRRHVEPAVIRSRCLRTNTLQPPTPHGQDRALGQDHEQYEASMRWYPASGSRGVMAVRILAAPPFGGVGCWRFSSGVLAVRMLAALPFSSASSAAYEASVFLLAEDLPRILPPSRWR